MFRRKNNRKTITNLWLYKLTSPTLPALSVQSKIILGDIFDLLFDHLCSLSQIIEPSVVNTTINSLGALFIRLKPYIVDEDRIKIFAESLGVLMYNYRPSPTEVIVSLLKCDDATLQNLSIDDEHARIFRDFHSINNPQQPNNIRRNQTAVPPIHPPPDQPQQPPATGAIKRPPPPHDQPPPEAKQGRIGNNPTLFYPICHTIESPRSNQPVEQSQNVSCDLAVCLDAINTLREKLSKTNMEDREKILHEVNQVLQDYHGTGEQPPHQNQHQQPTATKAVKRPSPANHKRSSSPYREWKIVDETIPTSLSCSSRSAVKKARRDNYGGDKPSPLQNCSP